MRNTMIIISALVCIVSAQLPKVAVSTLTSKSLKKSEMQIVTDKLSQALFATGYYDIMERSQITKILKEQGLQQSGAFEDREEAVKAGRLFGVRKMFIGSVNLEGKLYVMHIKVVDVQTGRIENIVSEEFKGSFKKFLKKGIKRAVKKLTKAGTGIKPIHVEFVFVAARGDRSFTVKSGDTLKTGDRIHLTIKPNQRCFVYVVNQDAKGNVYSIFPNPAQRYKALETDKIYHVPGEESSFKIDEVVGRETLYITAALTPVKEIEELIFQDRVEDVQKEKLLSHITTRGFAKIVKGDNTQIKLDKGLKFEGKSSILSGTETFQHKIVFEHVE